MVGMAGNLPHVRGVNVATCSCAPADAHALVDDVLLALKNDPPESPVVAVAQQHLHAFLEAEPEGSFARNCREERLQEMCDRKYLAGVGRRQ